MGAASPQRDERSRRRQHNHDDQCGPENQEKQMPQLQPSSALPLGCAEIADGWEVELGWNASLEQMQECRDRRSGEPQQGQRMKEAHVNRRSARPNGMSVCT